MFIRFFFMLALVAGAAPGALGGDWPAAMHDNARGGVGGESLAPPLNAQWTHFPMHGPDPAWPPPAKRDIWHEIRELSPVVVYDRVFHVVAAGDAVFFASSADDQVYALDAATGTVRWSFFAGGPVRLAPAWSEGRLYFAADDGWAYCLNAADGTLVWKYCPAETDRRIPGNGRIISEEPARTGVVVEGGTVWFFTGLFPPDHTHVCALDAATGAVIRREPVRDVSPQGYLLASPSRLFVPTGRTAPVMFDKNSLAPLGPLPGPGGAYAILAGDGLASGPGRGAGDSLEFADTATGETVASFPAVRMLVDGGTAYLQSKDSVSALDRERYLSASKQLIRDRAALKELEKTVQSAPTPDAMLAELDKARKVTEEVAALEKTLEECYRWKQPSGAPYAMILAGNTLYCGGENTVTAHDAATGVVLWSAETPGRIYGLAAANGRLFASSDTGAIHCFAAGEAEHREVRAAAPALPWPDDDALKQRVRAAEALIAAAGTDKGYCLVLGADGGRLAWALAQSSGMRILCVDRDAGAVESSRRSLAAAGLYGVRVAVQQVEGDALPFTGCLFNLVAAAEPLEGKAPSWPAAEAARVLRPQGGTLCAGCPEPAPEAEQSLSAWMGGCALVAQKIDGQGGLWIAAVRGPVEGAGEWTQLYADSGHTACSMDTLEDPTAIQWFGRPGPRDMVDRHHRPMASLFKNGRLHIPADDKVITIDGYNGFPLWELEVPGSRRVGAMRNAGQMLLTDEFLHIARDGECWCVDPVTGEKKSVINAPGGDAADWGYLNRSDALLVGTLQPRDASLSEMSLDTINNSLEGDYRPVVVSSALFAVDRFTGAPAWTHAAAGAVMNSMITIAGGRVFFVESGNDRAVAAASGKGRIRIDHFMQGGVRLAALDVKTGATVWEKGVELPYEHIAYLNSRDGVLLATGSQNRGSSLFYSLAAFSTNDGSELWRQEFRGLNNRSDDFSETGGSHGEQWQHPVLMGGTVYLRPFAFDLCTGEKRDYINRRGGHGCGGLTGSARYLFGRGSNPRLYPTDTTETEGIPLTLVSRPGCFLNIIPAGGIVMIPESSSGCTCAYPLQTSLALAPRALAGGVPRTR